MDWQIRTKKEQMKTIKINGIKCGPAFPIEKIARSGKTGNMIKAKFPATKYAHDAMEPIRIEVSGQDRETSKRSDFTQCAMATALCRACKADGAFIGLSVAWVIFGTEAIRFDVPESVKREVMSFDRHDDFAPGFYHLAAICPGQRLGVPKPGNGKNKKVGPARSKGVLFADGPGPERHITSRVRRVFETASPA